MGKNKKIITASAITIAFAAPLTVLAVLYMSSTNVNNFSPANAEVQIEENDGEPEETAQNEYVFSSSENGNYIAEKQVRIVSEGTVSENILKVKLVPMWCDENGNVYGSIGNISDFRKQRITDDKLEFLNGYDEVILTCNLAAGWQRDWEYNEEGEFFVYKENLQNGEKTSALLVSVEISASVHEASEGYELHIDVLADNVQKNSS